MRELSRPFDIETGVRKGDGLSPLLFNCALEKIQRVESGFKTHSKIRLGTKNKGIKAFAHDMALLAETWDETKKQTLELQEQTVKKTGLRISLEKKKIMSNIKNSPKRLAVGEQKIEIVKELKYLGEWIGCDVLEKKAVESRRKN